MMSKKKHLNQNEKDFIKEQMEAEHDVSSDFVDEDDNNEVENRRVYPSEITPQDYYQYKKMRIVPDAGTDFAGKIDKDVVLANIKGSHPDLQHTKFVVETIELFEDVFVHDVPMALTDNEGNIRRGVDGQPVFVMRTVFDDTFNPVVRMLLAGVKFELVGSRAMGKDREAVLDITTNLRKDVKRSKEQAGKLLGLGGGSQ